MVAGRFRGYNARGGNGAFDKLHVACMAERKHEGVIRRIVEAQGRKIGRTQDEGWIGGNAALGKVYDLVWSAAGDVTVADGDLAGAMQRRMSAPAGPKLSPREREVLDLLVDGLAIAQIARRLYISESTAKTHVANIYEKLGAGNRAQAVMAAVRLGLVSDEKSNR